MCSRSSPSAVSSTSLDLEGEHVVAVCVALALAKDASALATAVSSAPVSLDDTLMNEKSPFSESFPQRSLSQRFTFSPVGGEKKKGLPLTFADGDNSVLAWPRPFFELCCCLALPRPRIAFSFSFFWGMEPACAGAGGGGKFENPCCAKILAGTTLCAKSANASSVAPSQCDDTHATKVAVFRR